MCNYSISFCCSWCWDSRIVFREKMSKKKKRRQNNYPGGEKLVC